MAENCEKLVKNCEKLNFSAIFRHFRRLRRPIQPFWFRHFGRSVRGMPTHAALARRLGPTCTPLQVADLRALGRQDQPCEVWVSYVSFHRALGDDTKSAAAWKKYWSNCAAKAPSTGSTQAPTYLVVVGAAP